MAFRVAGGGNVRRGAGFGSAGLEGEEGALGAQTFEAFAAHGGAQRRGAHLQRLHLTGNNNNKDKDFVLEDNKDDDDYYYSCYYYHYSFVMHVTAYQKRFLQGAGCRPDRLRRSSSSELCPGCQAFRSRFVGRIW